MARHAMIYVQRAVKWKQQKVATQRAKKSPQPYTLPEHDELFELELSFKNRVPHRNGFGADWTPTRHRYWRPTNNNWKQHGRKQKQWSR